MFDDITNDPDLARYHASFEQAQIIFLEGDDSQDLYMLLSGCVEIFKGEERIREVSRKGAFFGEMSFFLGGKRTASVKAKNDVTLFCIPKEEIGQFLQDHPDAAREITRRLSLWLDETTQIVHGLKAFCDQLPDAVMVIDANGKMLAWNTTAEKLYGRDWHQMRQANVKEIYENPQAYQDFLEEVKQKYSVREKIFKIVHPQKGRRFISTSTTVLYDGHHNFQGVLTLGRDVTRVKKMAEKYKRSAKWLICMFIFLGIIIAAGLITYPYFSSGYQSKDVRQMQLRDVLAKDYILLISLLEKTDQPGNRSEIRQVMQNFFSIQKSTGLPYTGLILLDRDKKVIEAYSINPDINGAAKIGSSYANIEFQGRQDSLHKVLTLYRSHKDHPMGKKGIELAFELRRDGRLSGWVLFQMDTDRLRTEHGLDAKQLKDLQFE